jgi:hypothetical protein
MEAVMKKPEISHQPPSRSGGRTSRPCSGSGGSSESQKNSRTNSTGFQFTSAAMLRPMMMKPIEKVMIEATPRNPR